MNVCPVILHTVAFVNRPVTTGEASSAKFFALPGKMFWA